MARRAWAVVPIVLFGCTIPDENPPLPKSAPTARGGEEASPDPLGGERGTNGDLEAGAPGRDPEAGSPVPPGPPGQVRGLVGVGYGGLRITSRDGGKTWTSSVAEANGGLDDYNLLRGVAYANGMWLATGWCATTSTDGVTWTPLARINEPGGVTWEGASACHLVEGLASDGEAFFAVCGAPSKVYRSTDGAKWQEVGTIGDMGGHPALSFREGVFYAYGDSKASFRSTDAVTWSLVPELERATFCEGTWKSRAACHDASWFDGAYFRSEWQSKLLRSTDGASFVLVHDDPSNNALYQPRSIAAGWVAP